MRKFKYGYIALELTLTGVLSGGYIGFEKIGAYYSQFPDTIIKINSEVSKEEAENFEYPKEIEIDYALPTDSPLLQEGYAYAFKGGPKDLWEISVLKKTDEGYVIEEGEDKAFVVENPKKFGFKAIVEPTKHNGSFTITFQDASDYSSFLREFDGNSRWRDAFLHMKEKQEKMR